MNQKKWHKCWDVRFAALGGALLLFFDFAPSALAQVWAVLPSDVQDSVPDSVVQYVGVVLLIGGTLAKAIKLRNSNAKKTD